MIEIQVDDLFDTFIYYEVMSKDLLASLSAA